MKDKFSPGWSLIVMVDAGVPVLDVLKTFNSVVNEPTGFVLQPGSETELLDRAAAKVALVEYVLSNEIKVERDLLLLELDPLQAKLKELATENPLLGRLDEIYRRIRPSYQLIR